MPRPLSEVGGEVPHAPMLTLEEEKRAEHDSFTQAFFQEMIAGIRKHRVREMPNLSHQLDRTGRRTVNLEQFLASPEGIYLATDTFIPKTSTGLPDRVSFRPNDILRLGRENSRQQVFFGTLDYSWFATGETGSQQLAVKPILNTSSGMDRMLHEVAMYQRIQRLGIPTIDVNGVALLEKPVQGLSGFVVSKFNPEITTMDTFNWREMPIEQRIERLMPAIDTITTLHGNLLFHGDAEFKNIAVKTALGSVVIVDTEWGCNLEDSADDVMKVAQNMSHDLTSLSTSIDTFVLGPKSERLFGPKNDIERFDFLHACLFTPYYDVLLHSGSPHLGILSKAFQVVMDQKARQSRGEW